MVSIKELVLLTAFILLQESCCHENERNHSEKHHGGVIQSIQNQISGLILNSNNQLNASIFQSVSYENNIAIENKNNTENRERRSHEIPSFAFHKGREGVRVVVTECSEGNECKKRENKSSASVVSLNSYKISQNKLFSHHNGQEVISRYNQNNNKDKQLDKIVNGGSKRVGRNEDDEGYRSYLPDASYSQTETTSIPRYYPYNHDNSYTEIRQIYPVYTPDESRQNEDRTIPENTNGRNLNIENTRERTFTQESSPVYIPDDNSEQNKGRNYGKISTETGYVRNSGINGDERNLNIENTRERTFTQESSPVYIPDDNSEQNKNRNYDKISTETGYVRNSGISGDERSLNIENTRQRTFTQESSPVYIPDDNSEQNKNRNYDKISTETSYVRNSGISGDERNLNIENTRERTFTQESSPGYIPDDNSEQYKDRNYGKISTETSYERNSDISGKRDQMFSEGYYPVYVPNNSEQNGGRSYNKMPSEYERYSDNGGMRDRSFTLESSPVYNPDNSGRSEGWSYSKIPSENEYERRPDTGGTRERYFSEYSPVHNIDRYSNGNVNERYPDSVYKADRMLATGSSPDISEQSENEDKSNSDNGDVHTIQVYQQDEKSVNSRKSSVHEGVYEDTGDTYPHEDNHESEVSTQIEPNEKAEGRANGNDAVASYYDFLINEGSYKFWAVFQVITALLLIYSAFAAIYYAKYTFSQMDYPDYLDDGFFFKRSGDIYATTTSTAKPESFSFLGLSPQTFQRIMNAISSKKYS